MQTRELARAVERKRKVEREMERDVEGKHASTSSGGTGQSDESGEKLDIEKSDEKQNKGDENSTAKRERESSISAQFDKLIGREMG